MLAQMGGDEALDPQMQAIIEQQLAGTPGQVPTGGPSLDEPPSEIENENQAGPALPRAFNAPAGSGAQQAADSLTA